MATTVNDLRFSIYVNNEAAKKSLIDLGNQSKTLKADLDALSRTNNKDSEEFKAKKKEIDALDKEYNKLTSSIKKQQGELVQLQREGKGETTEYKKKESSLTALNTKLAENKVTSEQLRSEIAKMVKDGKQENQVYREKRLALEKVDAAYEKTKKEAGLAGMSFNELKRTAISLRKDLKAAIPDSPEARKLAADLKIVDTQLDKVSADALKTKNAFDSQKSGLSGLANGFNKYFAMTTAFIAGITGASLAFRKLSEDVAHMDDVYSDVMKTTNLAKEDVLALNEDFKKMDTRTSRESLNNLARDAGKLGLEGSKNILDFVDAGNQINVALGEDLGEDAIKSIGKMVGVFTRSTKELQGVGLKEQMLAVGSAINSLGASSSADESYLVAFAGRLGGVAKQAGISMDAILGFGSALDQDMQQVEMSATALQNFIMKLMGDPAKFAKLAGLEVKGFTKLLKEDANAAIKQVLTAMNERGGFQALIPMFEEMGLEGARSVGVLSSMAGSIDKIDAAQKIANKSMADGNSITKEYNIKNENLAAKLDKAKKAFQETALELGERLNPMLLKSVSGTTYLIKALVELPKWLKDNAWMITALAITWGVYAIAVNASVIADKLKVFWTDKVVLSLKSLTTAVKANPWGLIVTGVILAIGWLNKYLNKQQDVNQEQKKFNDLAEKSNELLAGNKTLEDRAKAMSSLSKSQLETLESDLNAQIGLLGNFDAEVKTRAQKALAEDAELVELKRKYANAKSDIERKALLAPIKWREDALLDQLATEYVGNQKSLSGLKKYLKEVQALIKTKPDPKIPVASTPDKKDPYEEALKLKEKTYKESQLELMEQRRLGELTEEVYNSIALQTQLSFLEGKKKLQEKFKKDTIDTEIEISNQKSKIGQDADKFALESIKANQEAGLVALESAATTKEEMLQYALNTQTEFNGKTIISEREYNSEMKILARDLATSKLALAEASLKALEKVDFKDKETQKKALEDAVAEIAKLKEALLKAQGDVAKDVAKGVEKSTQTVAERMKSIFGDTFSDIGSMFTSFTEGLDKLKNGDLKTWSDWGAAIGTIVQTSLAVAVQLNDEYYAMKGAALEADKQRELTNAGSNAEARDAINQKYAQKELDLKKKQSSADTVLKVAQAVAAGGLAIVQAFAQLGPIGGAIAAVFVGGMTALQVGTILKQNAAIQATTLDSSTSGNDSGATNVTGARVVTPQAAEGRYDVIGAQDRKLYRNVRYAGVARTGMVHTPTLYGEAGTELVISAPDLRRLNMKAPGFNNFVLNNRVNQRADGNYSPLQNGGGAANAVTDNSAYIASVVDRNSALIQYLIDNGLDAFIMLDQFEKKVALRDKSLKKGSIS
jgi:TP901 family phage tail tape measure protein